MPNIFGTFNPQKDLSGVEPDLTYQGKTYAQIGKELSDQIGRSQDVRAIRKVIETYGRLDTQDALDAFLVHRPSGTHDPNVLKTWQTGIETREKALRTEKREEETLDYERNLTRFNQKSQLLTSQIEQAYIYLSTHPEYSDKIFGYLSGKNKELREHLRSWGINNGKEIEAPSNGGTTFQESSETGDSSLENFIGTNETPSVTLGDSLPSVAISDLRTLSNNKKTPGWDRTMDKLEKVDKDIKFYEEGTFMNKPGTLGTGSLRGKHTFGENVFGDKNRKMTIEELRELRKAIYQSLLSDQNIAQGLRELINLGGEGVLNSSLISDTNLNLDAF